MKTLVISLNRALERREKISSFLKSSNIDFEFIDAVDGLKIGDPNKHFHPSVIATFLSHKKALEVASNNDITLILEDDAIGDLNVLEKIDNILKTELSWDVIFLGWSTKGKIKEIDNDFIKLDKFILSHAYIVNSTGVKRILRYLGEANNHIDIRLSEMIRKNIIRGIFTKEKVFKQNGSKTQIPKGKKIIKLI